MVNRKYTSHWPTWRMKNEMQVEGIRWMPEPSWKKDNNAPNYEFKDETEEAYQKAVKDQNERIKRAEDQYGKDDWDEGDYYTWLIKPIEEKLKAPDSDFSYDGMHKNLMPALTVCDRDYHFRATHKGGRYSRIRVPSMKRGKTEWHKFYNVFPEIAAQVRLGNRRFINGAKLKYIW